MRTSRFDYVLHRRLRALHASTYNEKVHCMDLFPMSTQTLERAIALLRLLASGGAEGRRLIELQQESRLTKPTIHRILATLRQEEFVEQVEVTRRYRLAAGLAALGWSAGRTMYDLRDLASEDMMEAASTSGDTSFLNIRTGHETVCIDRQTGSYPVKAFAVDVGTRRPLGVGASGVALLAGMGPEQAERALAAIRQRLAVFPRAGEARIREAVAAARRDGYALSDELVVKGVRAVAVCIRDSHGAPLAGISIAAINERMPDSRLPEIARILRGHASRIERRIASAVDAPAQGMTSRVIRSGKRRAAA